ncbi:hypothetical protein ENBRE01_2600 [Enteropsectra breve]|nr:hypothetical protein ENBRE01_2600 [Enteropsectra breve]
MERIRVATYYYRLLTRAIYELQHIFFSSNGKEITFFKDKNIYVIVYIRVFMKGKIYNLIPFQKFSHLFLRVMEAYILLKTNSSTLSRPLFFVYFSSAFSIFYCIA